MTHWARPGVKCVCVRDGFVAAQSLGLAVPRAGVLYTIRDVVEGRRYKDGVIGIGIRLVEIVTPIGIYGGDDPEIAWVVGNFRPLITRTQEQDMELFTPLLDVHNHEELEREFQ